MDGLVKNDLHLFVYLNRLATIEPLKKKREKKIRAMQLYTFQNIRSEFQNRVAECQEVHSNLAILL